jgi:hypothetical protein
MACQIGGDPADFLPPEETTAEQLAADQKKLANALSAALGPSLNPTR